MGTFTDRLKAAVKEERWRGTKFSDDVRVTFGLLEAVVSDVEELENENKTMKEKIDQLPSSEG